MEVVQGVEDPLTIQARVQGVLQALQSVQSHRVQLGLSRKEAESEGDSLRARIQDPDKIPITDYAVTEEMKTDRVVHRMFDTLALAEDKIQTLERLSPNGAPTASLRRLQDDVRVARNRINDHMAAVRPAIEARLRRRWSRRPRKPWSRRIANWC